MKSPSESSSEPRTELVAQGVGLLSEMEGPGEAEAQRRLDALEAVIERGLRTFVEVGAALGEIREVRLYREQGHATFEDYCRKRWGWGRNYANKLVGAAETATVVGTNVPIANEAQARALAPLAREDPEAARAVWEEEVREAEREGRAPTAEGVKAKAATREAPPSEEPPLPMPTEPEQVPHDGQVGILIGKALKHLDGLIDPSRSRPEDAAQAMARVEDDIPYLEASLREYAAWLWRVAAELTHLREADEAEQLRAYEQQTLRAVDREQGPSFHRIVVEVLEGIKVDDGDPREEYRAIPTAYRRKDGLACDEMASMLRDHYPQFSVTDERSLLNKFNRMGQSGRRRG